jgi:flagella synthesis protein FlgN
MAAPGTLGDIAGLLSRELTTLESLLAVLRQEHALLVAGASDGLTALAEKKSAAVLELGQLSSARDRALERLHLPTGRAGMDAWTLSSAGMSSQGHWNRLLKLTAEARSLNEANGQAITVHMQHNQQALAVLMAAADKTATYGPDGQPRPAGSGRSLGSA